MLPEALSAGKVALPPNTSDKRLTLAIDIDQTMLTVRPSHQFALRVPDFTLQMNGIVSVFLRPGLLSFLQSVTEDYEVVAFTSACQEYADKLLSKIECLLAVGTQEGRIFQHRLYRQHCREIGWPAVRLVKDLRVLGRDLANTVLMDDCPFVFACQPENALPIIPWNGDPTDRQLNQTMLPFLRFLARVPKCQGHCIQDILRSSLEIVRRLRETREPAR